MRNLVNHSSCILSKILLRNLITACIDLTNQDRAYHRNQDRNKKDERTYFQNQSTNPKLFYFRHRTKKLHLLPRNKKREALKIYQ